MLSAIRSRITYVNVVATLVLVFVMTGGALAAKKYLITSTKQISPSVLKSLQGKNGAAGAQGPAGAAGPQGPAGPQGAAGAGGAKGDAGAAGKDGAPGAAGPAGATGAKGETGLKGSNGAAGANGATGPAGPTCPGGECLLPVGATETGVWSFSMPKSEANGENRPFVSISFPLRLTSAPVLTWVESTQSATPGAVAGCPGTVTEPKAEAGKLCVYIKELSNTDLPASESLETKVLDATSGITIAFEPPEKRPEMQGFGTWAVAR